MSFILDALKKLEQKSQQGTVPDLMTVHPGGRRRPVKRPLWLVLVAVALVLNAVVLALVFAPWRNSNQPTVAQADPDKLTAERETTPPFRQQPDSSASSLPSPGTGFEKTAAVKAPDAVPAAPDRKPSPVKAAASSPAVPESTPVSPVPEKEKSPEETAASLEEKPAEPLASARLDLTVQELDDLKRKLAEEQLAPEPAAPADPQPSEEVPEIPGDRTIDFSELPPDIKSGLPELTISGHIFSDRPQSRLVNINGSVLREGERVSGDLSVEEITLSGVIFTYRGYRFLVRAF